VWAPAEGRLPACGLLEAGHAGSVRTNDVAVLILAIQTREKVYLAGFLLGAGLLLFLGRDLIQGSVIATWGLTFGGTTAVAVLGAALFRVRFELEASRRQLARKEAELSFAREVQEALFPRRMPAGAGLEFSGVCIPARGISGDYYDVMQLPDGRLVFAIADISGKGISAAILMANLQAVLRTLAATNLSPCEICSRLNLHLLQVTDESKFATFFYADWDSRQMRLRFVNAGHHWPIFFGQSEGRRLQVGGIPLGLFAEAEFQMAEVMLQPGDLLVLYSDGITEAHSARGEEFGERRLEASIEEYRREPLAEIQRRALEAVRLWSDGEPEDDMTLLIVRATPRIEELT
jgi:sigma-B regulation protein RsbU (phosphoserine phosphatase)